MRAYHTALDWGKIGCCAPYLGHIILGHSRLHLAFSDQSTVQVATPPLAQISYLHPPPLSLSLSLWLPQVASGQQFEDTLKRQLAEKRTQVLEQEKELGALHSEVATRKGKLVASEDVSGSHEFM